MADRPPIASSGAADAAACPTTSHSTPITPKAGTSTASATRSSQAAAKPTPIASTSPIASSSSAGATKATATGQQTDLAATDTERAILDSLIDDVIFSECLQVHRAAKMGFIFTEPGDELYTIKDGTGLDVFGQSLSRPKKQMNCTCPQCGRNIAASRLAPHLEKCMGMGRLSARAAASNKRDKD